MRKNNFYKIKGFTLIELLIAISIIAILSVVLSVNFSRAQKNGRDQRRITDLKAIQSAAEQYYLLKGNYPANKNPASWRIDSNTTTLQSFPVGPRGDNYTYTVNSNGFCACSANMESGKYGNADVTSYVPCDFQAVGLNYCVGNQQ
ncbi:MAG TPA: prepilin-type N-terminal cleavage/methylation domain-containing protein [Candidatus Woesebacteria bacterium]|jgi:general secretion pathway protein G|nr:prepilin-type N-terminal cleavage/methylation domain-containing protein [Candidatus Shapirobacteria bacterium]HOR02139.1 prepilin-type N-terminal cleavage/methylation domain-containing protein [Candidatus Woesebacteria bacterium]